MGKARKWPSECDTCQYHTEDAEKCQIGIGECSLNVFPNRVPCSAKGRQKARFQVLELRERYGNKTQKAWGV